MTARQPAANAKGRGTLLIIDGAENMRVDSIEQLRMLSNVNADKDRLLVDHPGRPGELAKNQRLGGIAAKPSSRIIDGVPIRFVESHPAKTDALLLSPLPESMRAHEATMAATGGNDNPGRDRSSLVQPLQR